MSFNRYIAAILWLCLGSLAICAQVPQKPQSQEPSKPPIEQDNSLYHQLVQRVKSGDTNVDFVRLRDSWAEWLCNEKVATKAPNRQAMIEAFEKKDYAKAVELAEVVLDYEFVQRGIHLAAEEAYRELGDQSKADFHKTVADKLLRALLASGTGKTAGTAYRVLTVREEYFIMNELGYEVHAQALLSENNKAYDVLSGKDSKTGKEISVYFDISSFFGSCKTDKKTKQD
jgi:hypothetical protein